MILGDNDHHALSPFSTLSSSDMADAFSTLVETASIVQNTLTEVLFGTIYGTVPQDVVRVFEEWGLFGDATAGTYFTFFAGRDTLSYQAAVNATTFSRDQVSTGKHPAQPTSACRLFIYATAVTPGRYKLWLKGKDFKLDELM